MKQSPALDTVGVGISAANVHLINLKYDNLLFSLYCFSSSVKALSFRTNSSCAIGFDKGLVSVWDLNNNKVDKDKNTNDDDSNSDGQDTPKKCSFWELILTTMRKECEWCHAKLLVESFVNILDPGRGFHWIFN